MVILPYWGSLLLELSIYANCLTPDPVFNCHCANNDSCDPPTLLCKSGCEPGWDGPGCQVGNIALNKPTRHMDTFADKYDPAYTEPMPLVAALAVDGVLLRRDEGPHGCASTNMSDDGANSWWYVKLSHDGYYVIQKVTIYNRLDEFAYQLKKFFVLVDNNTEGFPTPSNSYQCAYQDSQPSDVSVYSCEDVIGRRVGIYLNYSPGALTLCEVLVHGFYYSKLGTKDPPDCNCARYDCGGANMTCPYGCIDGWSGSTCQTGNVAFNKFAFQSSTYAPAQAAGYKALRMSGLAVDGSLPSVDSFDQSCSQTGSYIYSVKPWWYVRLADTGYYVVQNVTIYSRFEQRDSRRRRLSVLLDNNTLAYPNPYRWFPCAYQDYETTDVINYACLNTIARRVGIIVNAVPSVIRLCEVIVYGYQYLKCPRYRTGIGCLSCDEEACLKAGGTCDVNNSCRIETKTGALTIGLVVGIIIAAIVITAVITKKVLFDKYCGNKVDNVRETRFYAARKYPEHPEADSGGYESKRKKSPASENVKLQTTQENVGSDGGYSDHNVVYHDALEPQAVLKIQLENLSPGSSYSSVTTIVTISTKRLRGS